MTGTVKALFANCDNWGAKEWFERLVDAIKRQDECVLAKDELGFETYKHLAASSAMCLVREHAGEVLSALTASASEPSEPEMWQWREVRSNRHSPDDWKAGAWRDGRIPSTARAAPFVRFEERALHASPVPASEPEPVASTGEPVQDTWFTDRSLPILAMSGDVESDRVIKLHFRRPVTDVDRQEIVKALNLHETSVRAMAALTAEQVADHIGVTPRSDMRPFVVQAVKYARECDAALAKPIPTPDGAVEAAKPIIDVVKALEEQYGFDDDMPVDARHFGRYNDFPTLTFGDLRRFVAALSHPADGWREDTARLDALRDNSWDLRCFDIATGGDDYDIGWRVIGHWQAKPQERVVGEVYNDDPRAAIDAARSPAAKPEGE